MPLRFSANYQDSKLDYRPLIEEVFSELKSSFIEMPRGDGFVEYPTFEKGYQSLKRSTNSFADVSPKTVERAVRELPIAFVVFRSILGFTPSEWASITSETAGVLIDQNFARGLDRRIRLSPLTPINLGNGITETRFRAMIDAGVRTLLRGSGKVPVGFIHRLDKVDTKDRLASLQSIADLGAPYAMLLYERFLGRPFAGHRDSVSELVGEVVEVAIKNVLSAAKITFRETKRAEKVTGFDQAPDFIIPDEFNPVAVIEAKLAEDDGTARDKVARVQQLRNLRDRSNHKYDVIACIAGRGFKVRAEDMRRLLQATDGKIFTLSTIDHLIATTRISEYKIR